MFPKDLKPSDVLHLGGLAILALFIWLRDTRWMADAADTLPILVALPVFGWLTWPWPLKEEPSHLSGRMIIFAAILFLMGILTNFTWMLALGWCAVLWAYVKTRIAVDQLDPFRKLMILPMTAFPWIILDAQPLGWWFRLSGAWTTTQFLKLIGFVVSQEGTIVYVGTHPISVEPACSGMNTLQAMLIAGTVLAFIYLGERTRYWWNLPLLLVIAWVSNTLRIIGLTLATVYVGEEFAMGAFHDWGGWLILVTMFVLSWGAFALQQQPEP